jgi:hypothetical protein
MIEVTCDGVTSQFKDTPRGEAEAKRHYERCVKAGRSADIQITSDHAGVAT